MSDRVAGGAGKHGERPVRAGRRSVGAGLTAAAVLVLLAAGCGSNPFGGGATPTPTPTVSSPTPTTSSLSATPSASMSATSTASSSLSPSASASDSASASPTSTSAVRRGTDTGDDDVDVLVTLAYRSGKVLPQAPEVQVGPGERVKVVVTSDVKADIVVSGQPDKNADVGPGETEDIDFVVKGAGTTTVTLRQAKVILATFVTT